jgi:hypothetical protein
MPHPIRQVPHLRVSTLAGVASESVRQADYVPQGLKRGAEQRQAAEAAAGEVGSQSDELSRFAERAGNVVRSGHVA